MENDNLERKIKRQQCNPDAERKEYEKVKNQLYCRYRNAGLVSLATGTVGAFGAGFYCGSRFWQYSRFECRFSRLYLRFSIF